MHKSHKYLILLVFVFSSQFAFSHVNFWKERSNGFNGGSISMIAVDQRNNTFYAGTGGGVFFSTNKGTSWTEINTGLTNTNVHALAVSRANLFAGTYDGGVFLSTNNDTSWTIVNTGLTNTHVSHNCLVVSDSYLFVGTAGGVFLSTNNGTSWTAVNNGLRNNSVQALTISGTNLFAGTKSGGVFLSTDNGSSWTEIGLMNRNVISLAISGTNLFAGTRGGGVWRRPISDIINAAKGVQ